MSTQQNPAELADDAAALIGKRRTSLAIAKFIAAANAYMRSGDTKMAAMTLIQLGLHLQDRPKFAAEAENAYVRAAKIFRQNGNLESAGNALLSAGLVARKHGEVKGAKRLFIKAARSYETTAKDLHDTGNGEQAWDNINLAVEAWRHAARS